MRMVSTRRADINLLKNFITRTEDDYRPPYARVREKYPRQCIFIGTVNPDGSGYLSDVTGNRRFWCVYCRTIDLPKLQQDRDQLIAEAVQLYKKGETLYLEKEMAFAAEKEAAERIVKDPWTDIIAEWAKQ